MKNKKIAFIVKYFPTLSETFIINQINGLIDAGCQVAIYSYIKLDHQISHNSLELHKLLQRVSYFIKPPESKLKRLFVFIKWVVQHLPVINWRLFFKTLNFLKYGKEAWTLKLFFEAQWFLKNNDIEFIHAHFGMNGNRMAYLKAMGIIPNMPLVTTFHGYDLAPNEIENYSIDYAYLLKYGNAFTVNTPYLETLFKKINKNHKSCHILPVGLDTSFFKRTHPKIEKGHFDLIFCGKLIALKGPDIAIDIVKGLHDKGYSQVRLHLIGKGELLESLQERARSYKLQDHVLFHGAVSQETFKKHLEDADVLILPGRYDAESGRAETQGLVIQEAQAMELPVVVSDVGGMKYGLKANETGFVIQEEKIEEFIAAIEKFISEPELKQRMGKLGRTLVKERYDTKILTDQLLEIYGKAIEGS